jgi:ABC-type hemin transport system substrate-binding protein
MATRLRSHRASDAPRRFQYWSIDEFAYSILPAQDVVAVSESAYLEEISNVLANVKRFNPAVATDPERVVALDPDLMLVSISGRADYTSLARSSGIPVYRMQTMFETLDQIEQNIRLVGYMTGQDECAAKEAERFHAAIESSFLAPAGRPGPFLGLVVLTVTARRLVSRHCDPIGASMSERNGLQVMTR